MSGSQPATKAERLRQRVAEADGGPVDKGTYRAQAKGGSIVSCLPPSFVRRFGIEQSDELRVKEDVELGAVIIQPEEVADGDR